MSSEEVGIGHSHSHPHPHSHSHSNQLFFQDEALPLRFNCSATQPRVPDPGPRTRELTGFIDEKLFFSPPQGPHFRRSDWNANDTTTTPSAGESDDDDDDDEVEDGDGEVERLVGLDESGTNNTGNKIDRHINANTTNGCGSLHGGTDKLGNGKAKHHLSTFGGPNRRGEQLLKNRNVGQSANDSSSENRQQQGSLRLGGYHDAVTIAEPDGELYYSQYLQGTEGNSAVAASASGHKDAVVVVDNNCGFSGRKDVSISSESGESLRAILSDPITGALMDDAMILPCGHSFGSGGIQHVTTMKACYICSVSISEDSIAPNLSLRAAVQAFRREEELQFYRSSKRRRERFDQDKGGYGDSTLMDSPRGRGVQFPFAVTDRVIIKGNKRTPQRFVGREAIVTTQCLNGWYVVKTLDNAESVKLQYRSLAKVSDDPSSKSMSSKMPPNWL
ncbi:U-box domain-containing protein 62-like isoform X2 [Juglans microcarpa x Juglans regia]|uniref:U-box domain-containing protein 62-like isoform X2 n=1 Tax=Juglans microcarpa x Juglans regia TaxID=2249226 RepID=UPI001B7F4CB4|nr:U-box domain-containing protein 62-like isoform X2 [Juglans microcarpa x Juglans regia]